MDVTAMTSAERDGEMALTRMMSNNMSSSHVPEARVLIIMTGGTISMQRSPNGLIPARNFLERCMAPRPEFNDGETHDPISVRFHDGPEGLGEFQSLRTPTSVYGKRVRKVGHLQNPRASSHNASKSAVTKRTSRRCC
ncbi:hypothetical protein CLAIMM_02895 [Cladophialophora immunda]|nr:hypothetical protein CLAIMM_02895 [Cladophialophora immunda]